MFGVTRRYFGDDRDGFYRTSDERDTRRHVAIGWVLREEAVLSGAGPGHWELQMRLVSSGGGGAGVCTGSRSSCPMTSSGSFSVTSSQA